MTATDGFPPSPAVSVVLAAYDARRFIDEAVASIVSQTFSDWELIVVDDRSTDGTYERLVELAAADPRVRIIRTPTNTGVGGARDLGIRATAPQNRRLASICSCHRRVSR